jgi:hypothetical protein
LVGYRLVPVVDPRQVYQGGLWAEPDETDAAAQLRRLADDAAERCRLGGRARASVLESLGAGPLAAALHGIGLEVPALSMPERLGLVEPVAVPAA